MMTMRRTLILLTSLAVAGCGGERRAGTDREDLGGGAGTFGGPVYSADGRLAFTKIVDGKNAVFVGDADGRNSRRVSFGIWDFAPIWSPDGQWIAIGRDANGGDVIIVPSDSGAERVVASTPSNDVAFAWMPDGSALLFVTRTPSGDQTWIYDLASGTSERFVNVDGSVVAFPAPDGNLIGYLRTVRGQSTIWVWDRAANTHRQLTTEGFESIPERPFSPDGRSILYTSTRSGTRDVWRVDVASGELTQLTRDVGFDGLPEWSPDGARILFESDRGGQPDIWVLSTGESDVQRVTDDALEEDNPTWTPDGKGIVFIGSTGHYHAHVVPLDGAPALPRTSGDWDVLALSLSADGEQIVFSGTKNGDSDIWVVPTQGGEPQLVSGAPGDDNVASFSPDGREVVFVSLRGGTSDIWVAPTTGGAARRLTDWPSSEGSPRWAPDGRTILFLSDRDSRGADLWTVEAAGGEPVRRTTIGTVSAAVYSRDGKSIAHGAETAASGGIAVFTLPREGGSPKILAAAHTQFPVWSPDSREIAVQRTADGYGVIEVYGVGGSLLRKLSTEANVYEWTAGWSSDGSRLLVMYQDLYVDGGNRLAIQSAAGGPRTRLAPGEGLGVRDLSVARNADVLAAALGPVGRTMTRLAVP